MLVKNINSLVIFNFSKRLRKERSNTNTPQETQSTENQYTSLTRAQRTSRPPLPQRNTQPISPNTQPSTEVYAELNELEMLDVKTLDSGGYIQAHGTKTALSDPIDYLSPVYVSKVFDANEERNHHDRHSNDLHCKVKTPQKHSFNENVRKDSYSA